MKSFLRSQAFVLFLASALHSSAQDIEDLPNTSSASDVEMVADAAGNLHALLVENSDSGSSLDYYYLNGDSWQKGEQVEANSGADDIFGLDMTVGEDGGLHASYYDGVEIVYAELSPGAGSWQTETVTLNQARFDSAAVRARLRTSIDLTSGGSPRIVFSGSVGQSGDTRGVYAYRSGNSWVQEDITPGGVNIDGEFMVVSSKFLPRIGAFLGTSGPVVAYYQNGEYRLTQRTSTFVLGGGSVVAWSDAVKVADASSFSSRIQLDMLINEGVLHLVCGGTSPDGGLNGLLYHRWKVVGGLLGDFVSKTYEDVSRESTASGSVFSAVSLGLAPGNVPLVTYVQAGTQWAFQRARQVGFDSWETEDVFRAPLNFAGEPVESATVSDVFGRPAVIARRENSVDVRIVRETDFDLAGDAFVIPDKMDSESVPGALVVDGLGGVGYAYESSVDAVSYLYQNPHGGDSTKIDLELNVPPGNTNANVRRVLATSVGQDWVFVLAQVSSQQPGVGGDTQLQTSLFKIQGSQVRTIAMLESVTGFLVTPPELAIAGDDEQCYVGFFPFPSFVGGGEAGPPRFQIRKTNGGGNAELTSNMEMNVPAGYRGAQMVASPDGSVGIIGKLDDDLTVHFRSKNGSWDTDTVKASAGSISEYDLAVLSHQYHVAFSDGNQIWVANSVRGAGDPLSGELPRVRAYSSFDGAEVSLNRGINDEVHLITKALGGASVGQVFHFAFDGYPRDDASNLKSTSKIFSSADAAAYAFDSFGYPVVVANERAVTPNTRLLYRSRLSADVDQDGLPLFMELALGRDPESSDGEGILDVRVVQENGVVSSVVSFDRVPGAAVATGEGIESGIFCYEVEISTSLESFSTGEILTTRLPADGDVALSSGTGVLGGVRQELRFDPRLPDTFPVPRLFHRLKVSIR